MSATITTALVNNFKNIWSHDRNTMYRIPAGTDVIMFFSDDETGEVLHSDFFVQGPDEKVFNGTFLIKVGRCDCGCEDDLMLFHYASSDTATLVYQVNAQNVLVCSRAEYVAARATA